MLFTTKFALLAAAFAFSSITLVHAQSDTDSAAPEDSTGTSDADPCLLNCIQTSASGSGCSGTDDLTCICTSDQFQTAVATCLTSNCPASDIAQAQALQSGQCAAVSDGSSASGSGKATGSASGTGRAVGSASSALSSALHSATSASGSGSASHSGSSSSSSSAAGTSFDVGIGMTNVLGAALGLSGIIFGALIV